MLLHSLMNCAHAASHMGGLQPGFSSQMVSICAKSPDERLLPEWHDGSCEKFRCRMEHLQPTNGSDAPMGHLQPDAEILQALASAVLNWIFSEAVT